MIFDIVLMRIIWATNKPLLFMKNNFDKKLSAVGKSWLRTLARISSRVYNNMPPSVLLRSNLKGEWKPSIKTWPCGKLSSSLVFGIIKMSIEPLICLHRIFNLFLKELIFRCPNISLLILLMRMFLRVF